MSKASQREAREQREQLSRERDAKFSASLSEWLQTFAEYYPQKNPLSENSVALYEMGLRNLSPKELDGACKEAIRMCKFFPTVAEILDGLKQWRDLQPGFGTALHYDEQPKLTPQEEKTFDAGMKKLWLELERQRKAMVAPRRLTPDELEARQRSYFGYAGKWTQERTDKHLAAIRKSKEPAATREPGED